jgi:hypothetical protein
MHWTISSCLHFSAAESSGTGVMNYLLGLISPSQFHTHSSRKYQAALTKTPQLILIEELQLSQLAGADNMHTTCAWYILNGAILQCPDLHTLVSARLVSRPDQF